MSEKSENFDVSVGERAVHIRQLFYLSQSEVAKKLNVTRQTLANYEAGRTPMRASVIRQLCDIYQCPSDWILGITDRLDISRTIDDRQVELYEISPSIKI